MGRASQSAGHVEPHDRGRHSGGRFTEVATGGEWGPSWAAAAATAGEVMP